MSKRQLRMRTRKPLTLTETLTVFVVITGMVVTGLFIYEVVQSIHTVQSYNLPISR